MVDDLDIWRSAKLLLDSHGANADQVAQSKMDAMRVKGDAEGVVVWQRIRAAISELRRERRSAMRASTDARYSWHRHISGHQ